MSSPFEMSSVPDCLVLKIIEREQDTDTIDTKLYVLYDVASNYYVIRGKRHDGHRDSCVFAYTSENINSLADFISTVIDPENKWSYILYNIDNLPKDSNSITYNSLMEEAYSYRELSGYDNQTYDRTELIRYLKMLKNIVNYY